MPYEIADHAVSFGGCKITDCMPGFQLSFVTPEPNLLRLRDALGKAKRFLLKTKDSEMKVVVFRAYLRFGGDYDMEYDPNTVSKTVPRDIMENMYSYVEEKVKKYAEFFASKVENNEVCLQSTGKLCVWGPHYPSHLALKVKFNSEGKRLLVVIRQKCFEATARW